jgi:hypothetical protein
MKNFYVLAILLIVFNACSSVKKTQKAINYGNYDEAINIAIKNLRNDKTKKSNEPYVIMLQDAYTKATEKDLSTAKLLQKEGNPSNYETIYNLYIGLNNRQEMIKPLLPLTFVSTGKTAKFNFNDYSTQIITSKQNLSEYIYKNAITAIENASTKTDYRNIYNNLVYLNKINPNYKQTNSLLEEVHNKGTNFVIVSVQNNSEKIIPAKLEKELLNFDTYNLNDFWTVYHTESQPYYLYDYSLEILFQQINISPEHVKETELIRENEIKDGWKYAKNSKGETLKDSTGNYIKIDVYKKVTCQLNVFYQTKSVQVVGDVNFININNQQLINSFPLESQFVFINEYALFKGDRRALDNQELTLTTNRFVPFPSNEQMVYDCGEDLKLRIKQIIVQNKF